MILIVAKKAAGASSKINIAITKKPNINPSAKPKCFINPNYKFIFD